MNLVIGTWIGVHVAARSSIKRLLALSILMLFSTPDAFGADIGGAPIQMQEASAIGADGKPVVLDGDPGYSFEFKIDDDSYMVADDGKVVQLKADGSKNKFQLSVPSDMWIDGPVYFARYQEDYLILYEVSDAEDGGANMARIDGKTLAVKWTVGDIPFNTPAGLVVDKIAYVAGVGFVGAIDLDVGRYAWCVEGLYQGANIFDVFDVPQFKNKAVIKVEDKLSRTSDGAPYFVMIDHKIGKIVTNAALSKPIRFVPGCEAQKTGVLD
jgi:hypothetical protein